jgi:hypothetical protein
VLPALRHRVTLAPDAQFDGRDIDELLHVGARDASTPRRADALRDAGAAAARSRRALGAARQSRRRRSLARLEGSLRPGGASSSGRGRRSGWAAVDMVRTVVAWRTAPLQWQRRLPAALALGVPARHVVRAGQHRPQRLVGRAGRGGRSGPRDPRPAAGALRAGAFAHRAALHDRGAPARHSCASRAPRWSCARCTAACAGARASARRSRCASIPTTPLLARYDALAQAGRLGRHGHPRAAAHADMPRHDIESCG